MNSILDIIFIVFLAFLGSLIASITRGDRENIRLKVIIGTIVGTIILIILRMY